MFNGVTGVLGAGGGGRGVGNTGAGGGVVISVLVDVATNICGLDSEAISPSGRGIGLIYEKRKLNKYLTILKKPEE